MKNPSVPPSPIRTSYKNLVLLFLRVDNLKNKKNKNSTSEANHKKVLHIVAIYCWGKNKMYKKVSFFFFGYTLSPLIG